MYVIVLTHSSALQLPKSYTEWKNEGKTLDCKMSFGV